MAGRAIHGEGDSRIAPTQMLAARIADNTASPGGTNDFGVATIRRGGS